MTHGEKMVGKDFNPSGNEKVARLKELFAEAIDIVNDDAVVVGSTKHDLAKEAMHEALTAQMYAVKVVTFRED